MAIEISSTPALNATSAVNKINSQNVSDLQKVTQPSGTPDNKDRVSLTTTAERIRQTDGNNKQPMIDTKRVESLREQINNGNYRVNASRVADKLFAFESSLNGSARKH